MRGELKPIIAKQGQRYFDEPVHAVPKRVPTIARSVAEIFGSKGSQPIVVKHNRIRLNWIKP